MKTSIIAAAALSAAIAAPALADEVWTTAIGEVIYDHETEDGHAVLTYPIQGQPVRGISYFDGLAGVFEGRGSFSGVWIEYEGSGAPRCPYAIMDPETGDPRYYWGQTTITFVQPDFPGSWIVQRGYCFEDPSEFLAGEPVVAGAQ